MCPFYQGKITPLTSRLLSETLANKNTMKPKSHTLFHFTKNIDFVKNILSDGFWPRYCLEDLSWYIHKIDYIAYPIVCFCDIPLSRIHEHVNFYGEYGIGLTKEWALKNGLNPVSYLANSTKYGQSINRLFENHSGQEINKDAYYLDSGVDLNVILSHIKPLEGKMLVSGSPVDKEFYQESEWRYVPRKQNIRQWIDKSTYDDQDKLNELNDKTKTECSLGIVPADIKYIFVKNDSDIPEIINFIQTSMDMYSGSDQKILMSRVISLESITNDL